MSSPLVDLRIVETGIVPAAWEARIEALVKQSRADYYTWLDTVCTCDYSGGACSACMDTRPPTRADVIGR